MASTTMQSLRREAERQLRAYRQNGSTLRDVEKNGLRTRVYRTSGRVVPPPSARELADMRDWARIIDRARTFLRGTDPVKERFMARYFALIVPSNRRVSKRMRHIQMMEEFFISDSTVYKWKLDILHLVILTAMDCGKLRLPDNLGENRAAPDATGRGRGFDA